MTHLLGEIERTAPHQLSAIRRLTEAVGNTPLVRLNRLTRDLAPAVHVYGKAEWFNPGGSIKDRAALRMVLEGVSSGRLRPGKTLIDATSGNTGIGYAWIGATLGYKVRLCIPRNVGRERKQILESYGADLVFTDPLEGSDGAIREAQRIVAADPARYYYPDQYNNEANWRAHFETTGPEIWQQTGGQVTHFVAGLGTSGTFTGVGRRLRELSKTVRLVSFQPDSPFHGLDGMKHMGSAIVPGIYDPRLSDEERTISTEAAYDMMGRLAREEGLLAGVSASAAVVVALQVARTLTKGVVVTVLPDSATRYMSERFWEEMNAAPGQR
jgi:S-sulfo-L-cysteine synthase (O-acetyl-L-serine-dependent)